MNQNPPGPVRTTNYGGVHQDYTSVPTPGNGFCHQESHQGSGRSRSGPLNNGYTYDSEGCREVLVFKTPTSGQWRQNCSGSLSTPRVSSRLVIRIFLYCP